MRIRRLYHVLQTRLLFSQRIKVCVGLSVGRIDLIEPGQRVDCLRQAFFYVSSNVFIGIKLRFLSEITNLNARLRTRLALDVSVDACHDFEEGGFTCAIKPKDANFGPREK